MAVSLDYSQFHEVFKPDVDTPYDQHLVKDIEAKRKRLYGLLFVDRILKALGITKAKAYPPRGENGLYSLHQQICAAKRSPHQKISVLYYLLLDHDDGLSPSSQMAENFAQQTGLPQKYQIFMKGIWHMDHLQFNIALEHLTHPSLEPDFADEILTVLVRNAQDHENNNYSLPLAYYHSVKPVLKTDEVFELLFDAIAGTDVTEAFYLSRTYPDGVRERLFLQLVASVMGGSASQDAAGQAVNMVGLPFDDEEEAWFEEYFTTGGGRKLKSAKDTLLVRRIITGQQSSSRGEKSLGPHWGMVLHGLKIGMGGREG